MSRRREVGRGLAQVDPMLSLFGKHPDYGDFLSLGVSSRVRHAVDLWMQRGLDLAQRELHEDFFSAYDQGLFHCFVYRSDEEEQALAGLACAAADSQQRRFPLLLLQHLPRGFLDRHPTVLPALGGGFFGELRQALHGGRGLRPLPEIGAQLEVLGHRSPSVRELQARSAWEEERYRTFLRETCCADLGTAEQPGPRLLGDVVGVLGGMAADLRHLGQAVEVPLVCSSYARGLELRFYLELCQVLRHPQPLQVSVLWRSGEPEPHCSSLLLSFREPEGSLLAAVLGAAPWAVWRPGAGRQSPPRVPRRAEVAPAADLSLEELLLSRCPGYPRALW